MRAAANENNAILERGGHKLVEDGQPGPRTTRALIAEGFIDGIWAKGPLAEKPIS